jgi:hypothetical protein
MRGDGQPKSRLMKDGAWRASALCGAFAVILLVPPLAHAGSVQLSCEAGGDGYVTVAPDEFGYILGCSNSEGALFDPLGPNPNPLLGTVCFARTFIYDEAQTLRQHLSVASSSSYPAFGARLVPGSDQVLGTTARESAFTLDGFPGVTVKLRQTVKSNVFTQRYTFTNASAQTYRMRVTRVMDADFDPSNRWLYRYNYADLAAPGVPRVLDTTQAIGVAMAQSGDIVSGGYRIFSTYINGAVITDQAEQNFGFPAANLNGFFVAVHPAPELVLGVNENNVPTAFGTVAGDAAIVVQALIELPPGASRVHEVRHIWNPGAQDDCDGVPAPQDLCPDTETGAVVGPDGCTCDQSLAQCEDPDVASNHGAYLSCVVASTQSCVDSGLLTPRERAAIISEAARSKR